MWKTNSETDNYTSGISILGLNLVLQKIHKKSLKVALFNWEYTYYVLICRLKNKGKKVWVG